MTPFLPSPSTAEAATGQTSTERRAGIARLNLGFWRRASKSSKSPRSAESEQGIVSVLQDVASLSLADALASMGSRLVGLYQDEVSERQQRYGFNKVKDDDSVHFWRLLFPALANPFSILLTALAIIAIATGDHATFTVMLLMVIITTVLRLWQDYKSLVKASKLASCLSSPVQAIRKTGRTTQASAHDHPDPPIVVESKELVPGDLVSVKSGDLVPADCIIISSHAFSVSQSMLTGEILPVDKAEHPHPNEKHPLDPLSAINVVLSGSSVSAGEAVLLVVATGKNTYVASIEQSLQGRRPRSAFEVSVQKVSYLLLGLTLIMSPIVFVIQGVVNKSAGWKNALLFALSVAVGLTPEMLPLVVNANLAQGAIAMARKKVIVKRLDAVQNLGVVTCCCTDKTGTLTVDRVQLNASLSPFNEPSSLPRKLGFVNASLQTGSRSLLDQAITSAMGMGPADLMSVQKLGEIPFDSERRIMSVVVCAKDISGASQPYVVSKGAVDEILDRCTRYTAADEAMFVTRGVRPLDPGVRSEIHRTEAALNGDGHRLIAVAWRKCHGAFLTTEDAEHVSSDEERDLIFAGFLAFLDPPKADAADAVQDLLDLSINVKILTGDAPAIAVKVARDIGLLKPHGDNGTDVLSGTELAAISASLDRSELIERVRKAVIFAKVSPYQKRQVIELLKEGGEKVSMLGDGVNDALALQAADVGVSVDTGTEIAKEASDIILLEKSLSVVTHGVVLGRKSMINTTKYLNMAASSNFGNVFSITAASAWLPYEPMLPLQILVQNLLYDLSQSMIPFDNVDDDFIAKPIEWSIPSMIRFMVFFGPTSSIFDIATFSLNWWFWGIQSDADPTVPVAQTQWFIEGSITQTLIVYFLRTNKIPFLRSRPSKVFGISAAVLLVVAQVIPYVPGLNSAFGMVPPHPLFYGFLSAIVVSYVTLVSIVKEIYVRIFAEWFVSPPACVAGPADQAGFEVDLHLDTGAASTERKST